MIGERPGNLPFRAHVELLRLFLVRRDEIVERIQGLLSAQRKPARHLQDAPLQSRRFEDCFFALAALTPDQSRLRGQLQAAHWASGFRPREAAGMYNDLIDPAEMMTRAFHLWQQTRWPGRNGRARFAHTLFNLYVVRCLELLSMRLWDDGPGDAGDRLALAQGLLDELWRIAPADQPVLVRDARWLIPLAQSPTTDELAPYFEVAERIAGSFSEEDRIEIHKANVRTAGGHLRSQLRHYSLSKSVPLDDESLLLISRSSNALDFALLIQGLVPLLEAYERAVHSGDRRGRLELAGTICQGISPDPELFVNRVDLLGAYSMIEHLFTTTDREGAAGYTPMGQRHVHLLREYAARISRLSKPLHEDCSHLRPVDGAYSPYGLIYGFSSNLIEHIVLKASQPDPATRFSMEDAFSEGGASAEKLAWVNGWRKLPHIDQAVQKRFDYPQRFAEEVFNRVERALHRRAFPGEANAEPRTGRLFIQPAGGSEPATGSATIPDLPIRYIGSSDAQIVAAHEAHDLDESRLLHDRREGTFMVSYETSGGWVAITKDVLTEVLGAGRDVKIAGLPGPAAEVMRLMCPDLIAQPESVAPCSPLEQSTASPRSGEAAQSRAP